MVQNILYLFCTTTRVLAAPRCFQTIVFCTYSVDYYSVPIDILYYSVPICYFVLSIILYYSVPINYFVLFCTYLLFGTILYYSVPLSITIIITNHRSSPGSAWTLTVHTSQHWCCMWRPLLVILLVFSLLSSESLVFCLYLQWHSFANVMSFHFWTTSSP
jgi:hypothetical protein